MSLAALSLTLLVLLLLAGALRKADNIANRHTTELAHHKAALARIQAELAAGQITTAEAQAMTLDVQRRMLRLRPATQAQARTMPTAALVLFCAAGFGGAAAGYAFFGNASLVDQPARAIAKPAAAAQDFRAAQTALLQNPANVPAWIDLSMALLEQGQSARAVEALGVASKAMPQSADLWVARGQALMAHGGGQLTPAARFAFDRASALDPKHPGPRLYLALAWLQAGEPQQALPLLQSLARDSPAGAPWLPRVERMTRGAQAMIAAGVGKE
jgi:cytochrome c-type biogenesis protein CcmH